MGAQVFAQVGSVAATVVLARLLTPGDFGVIALAQSILAGAALLSFSGINAALVTRRGDIEPAASSFFWLAAAVGLAGVGLFLLAGQPLAEVLGQPDAAPYIVVLSLAFLFSMMSAVPNAILQRDFRFAGLNGALISAAGVYFFVEVLLALGGMGAWAVIIGQVAGAATGFIVSMWAAHWFPKCRLAWRAVLSDLKMTWGLGIAQAFTYVQKNVDYWSVSAFVGGPALGVYYMGYVLPNIVRLRITAVVRQVMLPAYAEAASSADAASLWRKTLPLLVGLGLPALVGVALVADPLIEVFLGSQWGAAARPMQLLTVAAALDLLITSVGIVAVARRQVRRYVKLTMFRAAATTALAVAAAAWWGSIVSVAGAVVLAAFVTLLLQEALLSRPLGVTLASVARLLSSYAILTGVMAAVVILTGSVVSESMAALPRLMILVGVGVASYSGAGWLLARELFTASTRDAHKVLLGR